MFSAWNEIQRRVPFKALILLFNTFKIDQGDFLKAKFTDILQNVFFHITTTPGSLCSQTLPGFHKWKGFSG